MCSAHFLTKKNMSEVQENQPQGSGNIADTKFKGKFLHLDR